MQASPAKQSGAKGIAPIYTMVQSRNARAFALIVVSQVVRTNELQSWFVAEHLQAQGTTGGSDS